MKTTISNTISKTDILGEIPTGAQFAHLNPTKEFIQKFYCVNDFGVPEYYGEQGGWHASFSFTPDDLIPEKGFLKIIS